MHTLTFFSGSFANGPEDLGSIPGRVMPKTLKMVLDNSLFNTQQYKVSIKGKVDQSRERKSAPLRFGAVAIEKGVFWSPLTPVTSFTFLLNPLYALWVVFVNKTNTTFDPNIRLITIAIEADWN